VRKLFAKGWRKKQRSLLRLAAISTSRPINLHMYRKISDFTEDWKTESEATLRVLQTLTDSSLSQKITPDGRSLGFLAWHITITPGEMLGRAGLVVECPPLHSAVPDSAAVIAATYRQVAQSVQEITSHKWSDEQLPDAIELYGSPSAKGSALLLLVKHQAHHRGQMSVLMRQAGLPFPGVYGPSREEWAAWGMPSME
jgi:uncharacterized damage-inducible protein DinB